MIVNTAHIDIGCFRRGIAQRLMFPGKLDIKRELLVRLCDRYLSCTLPERYSEAKVEQSFNEQIFSRLFDYDTLFSRGEGSFHMLPKSHAKGKFDDFSIGFFGGSSDHIIASVELKSPGASLIARQSGQYAGKTPIEQALSTASGIPSCQWVIVSNLKEMHLFRNVNPVQELAKVDLLCVKSREQVASLCALFDRKSLLGSHAEEAEMNSFMDMTHISQPLPPRDGTCRLVLRLTTANQNPFSLFITETRIRDISMKIARLYTTIGGWVPQIALESGWVSCECSTLPGWKTAISRYGDAEYSVYIPINNGVVSLNDLLVNTRPFWILVSAMQATELRGSANSISAELRDVQGVTLQATPPAVMSGYPSSGLSTSQFAATGAFECKLSSSAEACNSIVACLCDIAIQFRGATGGVALKVGDLSASIVG